MYVHGLSMPVPPTGVSWKDLWPIKWPMRVQGRRGRTDLQQMRARISTEPISNTTVRQ